MSERAAPDALAAKIRLQAYPSGIDNHPIVIALKRAPIPYVVVGATASVARHSRRPAAVGARALSAAAWPAAAIWNSPPCSPVRARADAISYMWGQDGVLLTAEVAAGVRRLAAQLSRALADEFAHSGLGDELLDRLLRSGAFDRIVSVVINHPATEALVGSVVDDPGLDRLIDRIMDSRMLEEITARLLASEEMQQVLEYVTGSPELRAVLRRQTVGLADDVAVGVRTRTVVADDVAERIARRLLRRRPPQADE